MHHTHTSAPRQRASAKADQTPPAKVSLLTLEVFENLSIKSLPLTVLCLVLAYFHTPDLSEPHRFSLYLICAFIGSATTLLRRHIAPVIRIWIHIGVLIVITSVSLLVTGLNGPGLMVGLAALMLSTLVRSRTKWIPYLVISAVCLVSAWLHSQGAVTSSDGSRFSIGNWISVFLTFSIVAVWTTMWGRVSVDLEASEKSLEEGRSSYELLFVTSTSPMLAIQHGRIIDANAVAEKLYGVNKTGLCLFNLRDLSPSSSVNASRLEMHLELAESGIPQNFEMDQGGGAKGPLSLEVNLFRPPNYGVGILFMILRDVTEQKRIENEHRQLASAVEQANESFLVTDVGGSIIYVNKAFERANGRTKAEVIGTNALALYDASNTSETFQTIHEQLRLSGNWQGRLVSRRKNGELFTEQISISPLRNDAGDITHFIAVKRDISHELKLEKQLNHSQKMEAVGHLAGGVAHDFNNMLQVVMGNIELISREIPPEHPSHDSIVDISRAAEKSATLVRQLLTFSRKNDMKLHSVELNELVSGITRLVQRVIGSNISLKLKSCSQELPLLADPGQLEQALMNLCVNARDAMPEGGILTIETQLEDLARDSVRGSNLQLPAGKYARLSVSDTGTGIPVAIRNRIFEPFFTTKETGKGTGLGLASVYALIQRHGGNIAVYSEMGEGTVFNLYFPLDAKAQRCIEEPKIPNIEELYGNGETILVAEDDQQVLNVVTRLLWMARYRVISCSNGAEAVQLWEKNKKDISLVLLDVVMPERNGRQAFDDFQIIAPGLPVVFATGYSYHHLQDNLPAAVKTVHKPYNPRDLYQAIRDAFSNRDRNPEEDIAA